MTTPADFGRRAAEPGQRTNRTLADILGIDPGELVGELHDRMDRIREAEREAERATAEVWLY
jgi:hypothetical protein